MSLPTRKEQSLHFYWWNQMDSMNDVTIVGGLISLKFRKQLTITLPTDLVTLKDSFITLPTDLVLPFPLIL